MFNNIAVDVVIGLVFIYLLYSLLATILQEIIAHFLNLRSRMLNKAIRRMLQDDEIDDDPDWTKVSIITWFFAQGNGLLRFFMPNRGKETFIRLFYRQPAIKYLGESRHNNKPSYLHSHNFSSVIVELLRGPEFDGSAQNEAKLIRTTLEEGKIAIPHVFWDHFKHQETGHTLNIPPETLLQFKGLFRDARQDPFLFRKKLEDWFDETMDRASGWYKRQAQVILFLVGLFLACHFNVDTISIYHVLAKDKQARTSLVEMAVQRKDKYQLAVEGARNGGLQVQSSTDAGKKDSAILSKAYEMVSTDAENADNIMGLGRSWDDSCKLCNDSLSAETKQTNENLIADLRAAILLQRQHSVALQRTKDSLGHLHVRGRNTSHTRPSVDTVGLKDSLDNALSDSKTAEVAMAGRLKLWERCAYIKRQQELHPFKHAPNQEGGWVTLVGWLLTALAISLGSPFWFDLLNKFMQLRGAGPKPVANSPFDQPAGATPKANPNMPVTTPDGKTIRG